MRSPKKGERYFAMTKITHVNDVDAHLIRHRMHFDDLTALYPQERLKLESDSTGEISTRVIDLIAPLGMGQRALIVAPPKSGKTTLMQNIAHSYYRESSRHQVDSATDRREA